jgi:hypothetical protein
MIICVRNDFRVGGEFNLLLVELGQSLDRQVWLVNYDRWRDEYGPKTGERSKIPSDWLQSVIQFMAREEAFDQLVRTGVFLEYFAEKWRKRKEWQA